MAADLDRQILRVLFEADAPLRVRDIAARIGGRGTLASGKVLDAAVRRVRSRLQTSAMQRRVERGPTFTWLLKPAERTRQATLEQMHTCSKGSSATPANVPDQVPRPRSPTKQSKECEERPAVTLWRATGDTPRARAELLARSGLPPSTWGEAIRELVDGGFVARTGKKRGTRYTRRKPPPGAEQPSAPVVQPETASVPVLPSATAPSEPTREVDHTLPREVYLLLSALDDMPRTRTAILKRARLAPEAWSTAMPALLQLRFAVATFHGRGKRYARPDRSRPGPHLLAGPVPYTRFRSDDRHECLKPWDELGQSEVAALLLLWALDDHRRRRRHLQRRAKLDARGWQEALDRLQRMGLVVRHGPGPAERFSRNKVVTQGEPWGRSAASVTTGAVSAAPPQVAMPAPVSRPAIPPPTNNLAAERPAQAVSALTPGTAATSSIRGASVERLEFAKLSTGEQIACFGAFYAMADIDGTIHPKELSVILAAAERERLPAGLRRGIAAFRRTAPDFKSCLRQLSNSSYELRCAVLVQLVDIAYADDVLEPEEIAGIKAAVELLGVDAKHAEWIGRFAEEASRQRRPSTAQARRRQLLEAAAGKAVENGVPPCAFYFQLGPSPIPLVAQEEAVQEDDSALEQLIKRVRRRQQTGRRRALMQQLIDGGDDASAT